MAYGVILKHLKVDEITWMGIFNKILKTGADSLFVEKEGRGTLF
jgi:hypothetical protein